MWFVISMVSCKKGPTRHAYAWLIGPFWQDTIDVDYNFLATILVYWLVHIGYLHCGRSCVMAHFVMTTLLDSLIKWLCCFLCSLLLTWSSVWTPSPLASDLRHCDTHVTLLKCEDTKYMLMLSVLMRHLYAQIGRQWDIMKLLWGYLCVIRKDGSKMTRFTVICSLTYIADRLPGHKRKKYSITMELVLAWLFLLLHHFDQKIIFVQKDY